MILATEIYKDTKCILKVNFETTTIWGKVEKIIDDIKQSNVQIMAFRTVKSEHIPRSVDFWFIIHEANLYTELVRHRVVLYISNTGMRYVMVAYNS